MKTMGNYIEKTAAGLRSIDSTPDAFIYFEGNDKNMPEATYDMGEILGIPVLRCTGAYDDFGFKDHDVPFVPVWRNEQHKQEVTLRRFRDAYYEY